MEPLDDLPQAFTVAQGRRNGLTRWDMQSPLLERPFHGLRAPRSTVEEVEVHPAAVERAAIVTSAYRFTAHMHEHEFFSHSTAACCGASHCLRFREPMFMCRCWRRIAHHADPESADTSSRRGRQASLVCQSTASR